MCARSLSHPRVLFVNVSPIASYIALITTVLARVRSFGRLCFLRQTQYAVTTQMCRKTKFKSSVDRPVSDDMENSRRGNIAKRPFSNRTPIGRNEMRSAVWRRGVRRKCDDIGSPRQNSWHVGGGGRLRANKFRKCLRSDRQNENDGRRGGMLLFCYTRACISLGTYIPRGMCALKRIYQNRRRVNGTRPSIVVVCARTDVKRGKNGLWRAVMMITTVIIIIVIGAPTRQRQTVKICHEIFLN